MNKFIKSIAIAWLALSFTTAEAEKKKTSPVVNKTRTEVSTEVETLLTLEQLDIEDLKNWANDILKIINSKQRKVIYSIERYRTLWVSNYTVNKEKIFEWNKLLNKYENTTFEIKTFLKWLKDWKYNLKSANRAFRKFESYNWKLLEEFAQLNQKMNLEEVWWKDTASNQ